jgi:hypothetical protein
MGKLQGRLGVASDAQLAPTQPHTKAPAALATGAPILTANPKVRDSSSGSSNVTLFGIQA